ncbi:unnamed protein product [Cuscuta epithymum]|uniref:BZIP domain-containing protein n=1 Tax=Cuscuta epithymum TaxID=186058 RepID=A0AAV0EXZ1_9ASTE|nr:unnamed protein product [Cuscuta epithymum]CAH9128129.1 unnamed protein product [Cuscuta epithymum]
MKMDKVPAVDEKGDNFRSLPAVRPMRAAELNIASSPSKMINRSPSECAFQRFLLEASAPVDHSSAAASSSSSTSTTSPRWIQPPQKDGAVIVDRNLRTDMNIKLGHKSSGPELAVEKSMTASLDTGATANVPVDSKDYQAFLKTRLYLACAAVAFSRGNSAEPEKGFESSISTPESLVHCNGSRNYLPNGQKKNAGCHVGTPYLPVLHRKSSARVRSTSCSEQSDDDELDGEAETTHHIDATEVKRARRMLSNRESARRSRRRKQVHQTELETQVSQLRVENSSLLKRLADISQKHNDAAVDNRILKADVETLRAKVKMAEETVKRVTGMNPLLQAMSEISLVSFPSFADSPSDASTDAASAVHMQGCDDLDYYQALSHISSPHGSGGSSGLLNIHPNDNVQQGLECPHECIRGVVGNSLQGKQ